MFLLYLLFWSDLFICFKNGSKNTQNHYRVYKYIHLLDLGLDLIAKVTLQQSSFFVFDDFFREWTQLIRIKFRWEFLGIYFVFWRSVYCILGGNCFFYSMKINLVILLNHFPKKYIKAEINIQWKIRYNEGSAVINFSLSIIYFLPLLKTSKPNNLTLH